MSPETLQGAWVRTPESALFLPKGWFCFSRTPEDPAALDNAHNLAISNRDSLSSEQEQEEPAGVLVQPAGETQHLLVSGAAMPGLAFVLAQDCVRSRERPVLVRTAVLGKDGSGRSGPEGKGLHCRELLALWNGWVFLSVQMSQYPRVRYRQAQDGTPIFVD